VTADAELATRVPGLVPGDYTVLSVCDTGTGMSPATLAHCFEPFFTTKPPGEGTGLGLAAVYGMVRQHGGHIAVRSSPGKGTEFDLYFPVADGTEEPTGPPLTPRRTVLLVEDEDLLRIPLAEQLKAEGYHVLTAPGPAGHWRPPDASAV
jgi:two-component system, cell cycle sensor histidine kinase and response regulator CckA